MDSMQAFALGEANRNKEQMVFDWVKAARIIKERSIKIACAGLSGDWEYTGGTIFEDGEMLHSEYTYLASTWAVPELEVDGEVIECFKMQHEVPEWGSDTMWPKEAVDIIKG